MIQKWKNWINELFFRFWWGKDAFYIVTDVEFNRGEIYSSTTNNELIVLNNSKYSPISGYFVCIVKRFEK